MTEHLKNLRAFAASRESQKEDAKPALVPKLLFPVLKIESHAKARSREEEGGGIL